jgi:ribosomal-protein-alanine N-acetyltransferase
MLRNLYQADMRALLVIEQATHAAPWTEETFKICFEANYLGWVIELDGQVIAFIIVTVRHDECHILNLCVAILHQHQGYGRKLLLHALEQTKKAGVSIVYLEVRRSNSKAIALYKKERFILVGERKEYYPTVSGKEDALVFAKHLRLLSS